MGLTDNGAYQFLVNKRHLETGRPGAEVLAVGAPDFWVTASAIARHGISTITSNEVRAIRRAHLASPTEFYGLSKVLTAKFFKSLGYAAYSELDIADRADIIWDLNVPVSPTLHNRFDLIWDTGTVEHIMNIGQALESMILMTKVGGKIVHTQGIGDQTNAGYWTFSPNFFVDFYPANGFRVDVIQLVDRRRHFITYDSISTKGSFLGSLIPLRYVPGYHARLVRAELLARFDRWNPQLSRLLNVFRGGGGRLIRRGLVRTGSILSMFQRPLDWVTGRLPTSGPDWWIFVVATRIEEQKKLRYPLQNVYRKIASAAAVRAGKDVT